MNKEDVDSKLLKQGTFRRRDDSAMDVSQAGRSSGLAGTHTPAGDEERTRRAEAKLREKLAYVDPVRSNSCNSLKEAEETIQRIMKTVDLRLTEKKVDGLRVPASTYTTCKTAQMVSCYKVTAPDAKRDDAAELLGAGSSEEPMPASKDSWA